MASMPGILTEWPWTPLGSFKYVLLAPWVIPATYSYVFGDEKEKNLSHFLIFPLMLWRMIHNQIWITLSRYQTAKGRSRIVDKGLEFDQVDRERNWDDQILFNAFLFYLGSKTLKGASNMPIWRTNGVIITILLHAGPVEFLYYWLHRALHHHYLYSRYHSHHHSSIVTEPITSVTHPFAEHIAYFVLFAIPLLTTVLTGTASIASFAGYITYIDFMNNMGHCNFELVSNCLFSLFPPLKYLMYTPSHPKLKINVVDGSSLAVAVVLNTIPKGTTQVLLRGNLTKVAYAIAFALCHKDTQVAVLHEDEYTKLNKSFNANSSSSASSKLVLSKTYSHKIWLVGDGVSEEEQLKAAKGTVFIPYSQFPPKKLRKDCFYHYTPAMSTPKSLENVHSCEGDECLACSGIVHGLEGWNEHECGNTMSDIDKIWEATIQHGFQPLTVYSTLSKY
ncbi:hypothetical protein FNV43_RR12170 [Rhamnella rubrinervis]|uniref:Uncharacterized protein n=1 Tax=Rhamnella rubrinervis TaxID=2594499 RepID=A0A8K0MIL8_9ROSA|nr:hypothetical protein FNV43_RR12170 [Rhamnella rubrinervis]